MDNYLMHYGIKGMKWKKRKKSTPESAARNYEAIARSNMDLNRYISDRKQTTPSNDPRHKEYEISKMMSDNALKKAGKNLSKHTKKINRRIKRNEEAGKTNARRRAEREYAKAEKAVDKAAKKAGKQYKKSVSSFLNSMFNGKSSGKKKKKTAPKFRRG